MIVGYRFIDKHLHGMANYLGSARVLAKASHDVNVLNKDGFSALHIAAALGDIEMVRMLISECGADPNKYSTDGFTALHIAAIANKPEVVRLLVTEFKVDIGQETLEEGFTALHITAAQGHAETLCVLGELGADSTK